MLTRNTWIPQRQGRLSNYLPPDAPLYAHKIRDLLAHLGSPARPMTHREFARTIGLSHETVRRWASGINAPGRRDLLAIERVHGIPPSWWDDKNIRAADIRIDRGKRASVARLPVLTGHDASTVYTSVPFNVDTSDGKYQVVPLEDDRGMPFYAPGTLLLVRAADITKALADDSLVVVTRSKPDLFFVREDKDKKFWVLRPPSRIRQDCIVNKSEPLSVYEIIASTKRSLTNP